MNTLTTFQCFTCESRTKFGGFNENDRYECWFCFKDRQRKFGQRNPARAGRPGGRRRATPTLYMDRKNLTDDAVIDGLRDRLAPGK